MSIKASAAANRRHQTSTSSSGDPRASNTSARVTNVPILLEATHTYTQLCITNGPESSPKYVIYKPVPVQRFRQTGLVELDPGGNKLFLL